MKTFWSRFFPNLWVEGLADISLDSLKEKGISGLILDLDNTLVDWDSRQISPSVVNWVRESKGKGFQVFIVSNGLAERVEYFSQILKVPGISLAKKPRRVALRKALATMELTREEVALVGDQVFTDVWGGNRLGVYTILVRPTTSKEFIWTRMVRQLEGFILKKFRKSNYD
ncbi:MAG: putative phosphatase [Candidatus Atribacteria bacterium]|nr:putative phosphatase [Candidatus Atribacteria bacterium]